MLSIKATIEANAIVFVKNNKRLSQLWMQLALFSNWRHVAILPTFSEPFTVTTVVSTSYSHCPRRRVIRTVPTHKSANWRLDWSQKPISLQTCSFMKLHKGLARYQLLLGNVNTYILISSIYMTKSKKETHFLCHKKTNEAKQVF